VRSELGSARIGAGDVEPGSSGVSFRGDRATLYRANLWLRSGIRVLGRIASGRARGPDELYALAREVDWTSLLGLEQTFSVEARVRDSGITHSKYAALRVKDALCDRFRELRRGRRPNVQVHGADLPLFLTVYRDRATLYRDWSGETLHKRGYRDRLHRSSLNEAVAAAMLAHGGWNEASRLVDPMCGAGTLAIEAALVKTNRAPGLFRGPGGFPFERWPDHDARAWESIRREAEAAAKPDAVFRIAANDEHPGSIALARRDAGRAGVADRIELSQAPLAGWEPPFAPDLVAVNPPWGERLRPAELRRPWEDLRRFLKDHCAPSRAVVLSGNARVTRHLGLRASRRIPVRIGKVDGRILRYEILPPRRASGESPGNSAVKR